MIVKTIYEVRDPTCMSGNPGEQRDVDVLVTINTQALTRLGVILSYLSLALRFLYCFPNVFIVFSNTCHFVDKALYALLELPIRVFFKTLMHSSSPSPFSKKNEYETRNSYRLIRIIGELERLYGRRPERRGHKIPIAR